MEKNKKKEGNVNNLNRMRSKQILAILMAILMVVSVIDDKGLRYVSADGESKVDIITGFTALSGEIANQQLAVGASASEITLPTSLSVSSEVYYADITQVASGGAITVSGSAISVKPSYNLAGVTWKIDAGQSSSASFDSSVAGTYYTYVAVLPTTDVESNPVQLAQGVSLPQIKVEIIGTDEASVTEANGTLHTYATVEEAFAAAQGMPGCTVKLLKNVATENAVNISSGTLTFDLNGKAWTNTFSIGSGVLQLVGSSGNTASLTAKDSVGGGSITTTDQGVYGIFAYQYYSLILEGGSYSGIWSYVNKIGDLLADGCAYQSSDGTWVSDLSVKKISNVTVQAIPVKITTQPEDAVELPGYSIAPTLSLTTETVLADSGNAITYQWYSVSTGTSGADEMLKDETSADFTVPTGLPVGTYSYYCAVTCDKYTVNTRNVSFFVNASEGNYTVTASNGITINYPTLEEAITAAKSKPNSTVKLLADATTANRVEVSSGTFTIDLKGKTWTSTVGAGDAALNLTYGSHVTLKDSVGDGTFTSAAYATIRVGDAPLTIESGTYKNTSYQPGGGMPTEVLGAFGSEGSVTIKGGNFISGDPVGYVAYFQQVSVAISGGTFKGRSVFFESCNSVALSGGEYSNISVKYLPVAGLLVSGYGFKNVSGGTWVNNLGSGALSHVNDLSHNFLSYATTVQPVPVKITAQPQGGASATYGYTSAPFMSVTAAKTDAAPEGSNISYQWYRVKSGGETSDTAVGTNSSTLTIPTGLAVGTHSFYCVVTCDGYILNSGSATFTVEKSTPTIELRVITREDVPFLYGESVYFRAIVKGINDEKPDGTVTFQIDDVVIRTVDYDSSNEIYQTGDGHTFNAGPHSFTAIYTPSADGTGMNYVGVTSAVVEQTIDKADQSELSITEITGKKYGDAPFTLEATGGEGTGTVTISVPENNDVLSVEGGTATIIGAGTVTVTATKAADANYNEATTTRIVTVAKADTSVSIDSESYQKVIYYTGKPIPIPYPAEGECTIVGAAYSDVIFTWLDSNNKKMDNPPTAPGNYLLEIMISETKNIKRFWDMASVRIVYNYKNPTFAYNGSTAKSAFYKDDVVITAAGYTVSDSLDGEYLDAYLISGDGEVSKTLYFKEQSTGYVTNGKNVSVNIDKSGPTFSGETDGITISDNHWKTLLNTITFGHFFKDTKDVSIMATDSISGVAKYYYYIDNLSSPTVKTAEELNNLIFTEVVGGSFTITNENKYILYAYSVDLAGNRSAYICTEGIVIDKTAPTISLTAPVGPDLRDVSGVAKVQMNETGTITYVISTIEDTEVAPQNILDDANRITRNVIEGQAGVELEVALSGLTANTTYYMYAVGTDRAGNNSSVKILSFATTKTKPAFPVTPTITGTYGQQVKDMTVSQVASTNGVAGSWSISGTEKPSVGTSATYYAVFTPEDTVHYDTETVPVIPIITSKSLTAAGVTIGEVTGTYTYDGSVKKPVVTVSDSTATITASDYEYSYSDNTSAGTATLTITGRNNYTGTVSRTFAIGKAAAPNITYPMASGITYGQKLSESILTGGSTQYGTFAWADSNIASSVANSGYEVCFTPSVDTKANYDITNTTDTVAVAVSKAAPTVTVNVALSGNAGSRKATLTATITGVGGGEIPTGTVKFVNMTSGSDADITGATAVAFVGGQATFEWIGLADQLYKVKAVYSGSSNYHTAESGTLEVDTRKQNQSALNIGSIGTKTYGDGTFTLTTNGGSGNGAVTFTSDNPTIVSIIGTTATIHNAGAVTITATKAEDSTYNPASISVNLMIATKAFGSGAGVELTLSQNSYTYDGTAKEPGITAKLDGKTLIKGTDYVVSYFDNIDAGSAQVTLTGQGNYNGMVKTNFTIAKANQNTLEITAVTGKKYLDSAFALTAAGGSSTGTVTYSVPENNGVLSISGNTATILGAGTVTVTAVKAADDNYNRTTTIRDITIAKAAVPVISFPTAGDITYGQKLSSSTLTGGSTKFGTFAWADDNIVPSVANNGYEVTFTPGISTLKNYEAITNTTDTIGITVTKAAPAVTLNAELSGRAGSRIATLTATITGVDYGEVPFGTIKFVNTTSGSDVDIAGATAVTITGGKATFTWTGLADQIYKVKAVYSGSDNYDTATGAVLELDTRKQVQAELTIENIGTKTYGDSAFTLTTTGGSSSGMVTFTSSDPTIVSIVGTRATIHKAGAVTITANKAEDSTYNEVTASVALSVGKKALNIKADSKQNIIKGAAMPELTYTVTGLVGSDTFANPTVSATAADMNTVGEYDINISGGTFTNADSYTITYTGGKLMIVNAPAQPSVVPTPDETPNTAPDATLDNDGTLVTKVVIGEEDWKDIQGQIEQMQEGETVIIETKGYSVVPREVLDSISGTDTTLVFDLGNGITWSINGQSITDNNLEDIDFGVTMDTDDIPDGLISGVAGEQPSRTISLSHDGTFGFHAVLSVNMTKSNAGLFANLYYYNPSTQKLELQSFGRIDENGQVEFNFTHASDYVITTGTESMLAKAMDQITINTRSAQLYVGGTRKKSMTLKLELPEQLDELTRNSGSEVTISYHSSDPKVATITDTGKIIAKKTGKTTITTLVTIDGLQKSFATEIVVSKAFIKLIKSTDSMNKGNAFTFQAKGYGVNTEDIMYYTSKKSVIAINKTTGKAVAKSTGIGYIIVRSGKVEKKIKVKVKQN